MTNLALYRKYRPKTFDDVLGQDHIVEILKNAIRLKRISHAYLFSGPRGTGKTSVARILAREAGCSQTDLIEIDAASSRGIDEIRALKESVHFAPLNGKIKVYIIDEVHMLTKEAFNALLKTLEEPPSHVIFILATTEIEKVPETIVSRCQNFNFYKIPENILRKSIVNIARGEGFEIEEEAASLIALSADGSFRDAQGLLDQILSLADNNLDKKITGIEVRNFLSVPAREMVENFILAILKRDGDSGLKIIQEAVDKNLDIKMFLKLILRDLRSMLLLRFSPSMIKQLEEILGEREFRFVNENAKKFSPGQLEKILKEFIGIYDLRGHSFLPQLPLELAFLKIVSENNNQ